MSLINFLNAKLKPSVDCEAVSEDGYEVNNLISDDAEQLSRGFMAYSVTKPPIEIIFEFPKAIDLKVIKLWNSHGALRSTAFELHGKFDGIWERVAYVRDLAKDVDSVTFCYQSDYSSRSSEEQSSEKVFFFRTAHKLLSNTNCIKLIVRATHQCPPVVRKIQIWGLPSRSLDKADRELIKSIWKEITYLNDNFEQQRDGSSGQRSSPIYLPELNVDSTLEIPEEFLDALTWEVMIFPTVLPSGKIVDQSTIDKHSEEESKWGRMPSDPFTGLEFTPYRKAILNLALKARIEKFLMDNYDQFKTLPRSLGSLRVRRSRNRHASQIASLCHTHTSGGTYSSLSKSYKSTATATLSSSENVDLTVSYTTPAKRPRLCDMTVSSSKIRSCEGSTSMASTATQTSATATTSFTNAILAAGLPASALSSSATATLALSSLSSSNIDRALQLALHKITRYTQLPMEEYKPDVCIKCNTTEYSYKIQTCGHLVCRQCLIQLSQQQKCICSMKMCNADIERYHKL